MKKRYKVLYRCCNHYNGSNEYVLGYAILPIFKIAICKDCGVGILLCNSFLSKIFELFFAPFWTGKCHTDTENVFRRNGDWLIKK